MDAAFFKEFLAKLLIIIFKKFEVDKEFEALGIDISGLLGSLIESEDQ